MTLRPAEILKPASLDILMICAALRTVNLFKNLIVSQHYVPSQTVRRASAFGSSSIHAVAFYVSSAVRNFDLSSYAPRCPPTVAKGSGYSASASKRTYSSR